MKLTKKDLRAIILEELRFVIRENSPCMYREFDKLLSSMQPNNWIQAAELATILLEEHPECAREYRQLFCYTDSEAEKMAYKANKRMPLALTRASKEQLKAEEKAWDQAWHAVTKLLRLIDPEDEECENEKNI